MSYTILVVEDEEDVRENIKDILTVSGHKVITANNGKQAIEELVHEMPEIILSDVTMPEMNGYELLEFVQNSKKYCHIPFIFLTAKISYNELRTGMLKGADDYVTKPFKANELIDIINVKMRKSENIQNQLKEIKEDIALSVPHELRTPLTPIIGYSGMLIDDAATFSEEEVAEIGKNIMHNANRLKKKIEKFVLYSSLKFELNSLKNNSGLNSKGYHFNKKTFASVLHSFEYSNSLTRLKTDLEDVRIKIPDMYFKICINELLENSLKFSFPDTKINVIGKIVNHNYSLSFQNKGVEFTKYQIRKINVLSKQYDPSLPGSGLGIPIVKNIVEYFGGELHIVSNSNETVIVTLKLPIFEN